MAEAAQDSCRLVGHHVLDQTLAGYSCIDEELNLHLELRVEELTSRGITTDEARQENLWDYSFLRHVPAAVAVRMKRRIRHFQRTLMLQDFIQHV